MPVTPGYSAHDMLGALQSRYVNTEDIPWTEARHGSRMKTLYKDNEAREALILIEAPPGCVLAEHEHTGTELTFVLEGSLEDDEGVCKAGDFVWRPPGSIHQARTPDGCTMLVLFKGGAKTVGTGRMFPIFDE
jgi:anti-sigma factor ChrR (cupin superfamily)